MKRAVRFCDNGMDRTDLDEANAQYGRETFECDETCDVLLFGGMFYMPIFKIKEERYPK